MNRGIAVLIAALITLAGGTGAADGKYYVPKPHAKCRAHYKRETVKIKKRVRRHGRLILVRRHGKVVRVRQIRCVHVTPKPKPKPTPTPAPAPAPAATVSYKAAVDPAFTQDPRNPLAVTYQYSATAIATLGSTVTNLAQTGQLPAGVLNFYSATTPGGPQQLFCSMNVGAAVIGGGCPITYAQTGVYSVTTQYIPNAASAVTQTDVETISPYSTTATLSATQGACGSGSPPGYTWEPGPYCAYTLTVGAVDQNGNSIGPDVLLTTPNGGGRLPTGTSCTVYVTAHWILGDRPAGQPPTDCSNFDVGSGLTNNTSWAVTATYTGSNGWAASPASAAVTLTP